MKFFLSMVGFILLVIGAFYLGYQSDLGPVDDDMGGMSKEESIGGIRGGTSSGSIYSPPNRSGSTGVRKCIEGARCN